jgi:hypothetical protein
MANTSADWLICHEILVGFSFLRVAGAGSGATHRNPNSGAALITLLPDGKLIGPSGLG